MQDSDIITTSPQEAHIGFNNTLKDYIKKKSKQDFLTYVRMVAPTLVTDFKMGRHIELLCDRLQKVAEGDLKRLMIFLPPRSSKSLITSKLFPSWYIGHFSNHEIMSISHSDQLASDFGRSVRDIVNTEEFQRVFKGVSLRSDVKAAGKWKTNHNGSYYAAGVRSQIAGRGAHLALLDDVMSEEDSFSEAGRRYIKEWWPSGLRTRLMPNGAIIIINTRYHFDDLCGWLLKQENELTENKWEVISIPAWLDETAADLLGLPEGGSYFPEWKPDEVLRTDEQEIRASNGLGIGTLCTCKIRHQMRVGLSRRTGLSGGSMKTHRNASLLSRLMIQPSQQGRRQTTVSSKRGVSFTKSKRMSLE